MPVKTRAAEVQECCLLLEHYLTSVRFWLSLKMHPPAEIELLGCLLLSSAARSPENPFKGLSVLVPVPPMTVQR